ncbi:c-type cytochrome [Cupriavidus basilensis]
MKRMIRIGLWSLTGVCVLAAGVVLVGVLAGERKGARIVSVPVVSLAYRDDAQALARGKYLYESRGCMDCHGASGKGRVFIDDPGGLYVRAPNLTSGSAVIGRYREADWVRAIRHGVAPSGRALMVMPSEDYNRLSDDDLGALVAYVRSLPPVPGEVAEVRLPWMVRALYGFGLVKDAAEKIDHGLPPARPMTATVSPEYGAYVANACLGCHGTGLRGGKIPGAPPDWPPAADLTPAGSAMARYDAPEKFVGMMRSGLRPDGSPVSRVMPFDSFGRMDDVDLGALYLHLKALPAQSASR